MDALAACNESVNATNQVVFSENSSSESWSENDMGKLHKQHGHAGEEMMGNVDYRMLPCRFRGGAMRG